MGLFDSFRQTTLSTMNTQQAIMTVVVAAIKADGHVSDEENQRLHAMCILSPIFAANSVEQDNANIRFADMATEQYGEDALSKAIETLSQELRETAFAFACDMVVGDGVLTPSEEEFINNLASRLELRENVPESIVFATIARNRSLS